MISSRKKIAVVLVLLGMISSVMSVKDDEFKNGKLTSGQVYGGHKYHHILVEPKAEKSRSSSASTRHFDSSNNEPNEFAWFTSSRGKIMLMGITAVNLLNIVSS